MIAPVLHARLFGAGLAALMFATLPAAAGEVRSNPKAVIELFTSQGCASCPPADALLEEFAKQEDVVALAFHVDYWDYIGWPDTFGAAENSDRQRAYAASWKSNRIYTPQLVVNGVKDVVGSRREDVGKAIREASLKLPVALTEKNDMLVIDIAGKAGIDDAVVWLVTFKDKAEVAIERGENAGQKISYSQVVTGKQLLGVWEADTGTKLKLPLSEVLGSDSTGAAVIVQQEVDGKPGPIIGAASYQQ